MTMQPDPYPPTLTSQPMVDAAGRPLVAEPAVAVAPTVPVVEPVVVQPAAVHQTVATSYGRRYAFDSVVVGLVGLAFLLMGLVAMTRAGFDGSMRDPVVEVVGFTHTATLGIIEAAIGLCLVLCAATMTRGGSVFFGLVLGVGGFVGAVQTDSFRDSLALESSLAWLAVVAAILVVLVSLLIPRMVTRTDRVEAI
ncbi:MAG: hypothetical protein HZB15_05835 [Actinobacteria bacterium]|nr:hypothetical protein [Actinomycetota bacterium]